MSEISTLIFFASEKELFNWTHQLKKAPWRTKIIISPVWNKILKFWSTLFELIQINSVNNKNTSTTSKSHVAFSLHISLFYFRFCELQLLKITRCLAVWQTTYVSSIILGGSILCAAFLCKLLREDPSFIIEQIFKRVLSKMR